MAIAATGFFDGVHKGHRFVLDQLIKVSKDLGQRSEVITFWPHPRVVLNQDADNLRLLTTMSEKRTMIRQYGVDDVIVIPFTSEFANLTSRDFLSMIRDRYDVQYLIIGYDHKVGCDGDMVNLSDICREVGIHPYKVSEYNNDGCNVSSTEIRRCLSMGEVGRASALLGYDYLLTGIVVEGNRMGRTIGFPTANLSINEPMKIVPSNGVYFVDVIYDKRLYKGICNIGYRPTLYNNGMKTIETHILNFDEEIYGRELTISFVTKIRDEMKFSSLEMLRNQIEKDKQLVESIREKRCFCK